jgi:ABC-2 type transport system ATP-binding protein
MLQSSIETEILSPALLMESVSYRYGNGHHAVSKLNLRIEPGILGLLGPNGAGKSTLMRMLATLTRPTEGRILWGDVDIAKDPNALRRALGYLPQEFGAYPALSAREFLHYLAAVKGLPHAVTASRVDECLEAVGLTDAADKRIATFSGGMRQRVGIAQALLNDPRLLIVDEPTVGLDPEERLRFRNLLTDLSGQRLVILSTHIVSDIEASATALAVMDSGTLRFHGTPETLIARAQGKVWDWTVKAEELAGLRARHHVSGSLRLPDGVRVRIVAARSPGSGAQEVMPGLEDAYVWLLAQGEGA